MDERVKLARRSPSITAPIAALSPVRIRADLDVEVAAFPVDPAAALQMFAVGLPHLVACHFMLLAVGSVWFVSVAATLVTGAVLSV